MALNPEISLGIRPQQPVALPPITSPLDRYQKMLTLRHLMTQGQLGTLNLEQTRLENERLQREAQEQQSLGSWMQQNQRPDLTPQEIVSAHPNPTGIKFATAWSAQQTGALTQYKTKLEVALEGARTDDRIYNSVTPGDKQSKLAALAQLVQLKRITGDQAAQIAGLPDEEFANLQQRAALSSQDRLQRIQAEKEAIERRIAAATEGSRIEGAKAEGTSKTLDVAQKQKAANASRLAMILRNQGPDAYNTAVSQLPEVQREPFMGLMAEKDVLNVGRTPQEISQSYQAGQPKDINDWIAITKDESTTPERQQYAQSVVDAMKAYQIAVRPVNVFNPPAGITGQANVSQVPEGMRGLVKAISEYRTPMPSLGRNNPYSQELSYWVNQVNPAYDATQFPARSKTQSDFSAGGKSGQNITSFNTAIGHLGTLYDAAEGLNNTAFRGYNNFANWLANESGKPTVKPFAAARTAVAEELAKALKGGVATQGEVEQWHKIINEADSPQQLRTSIKTIVELMASRIHAMEDSYTGTMGHPPEGSFVREKSQRVLDKIAGGEPASPGANPNPTGYIVGHRYGGMTYLGGDPKNQTSWR